MLPRSAFFAAAAARRAMESRKSSAMTRPPRADGQSFRSTKDDLETI